jgi:A/G-specific adenine glycosylase
LAKNAQNSNQTSAFATKLLQWYHPENRNLPWKNTQNPYLIWLSEIILQQTRVAQGTPYYLKFEKSFPTIESLANAPIEKVLKLWEGLGYYSRARNLHAAAKYVVDELNGAFPNNYKDLLQLKGIGEYTAAAIASFAYDEPVAVVDGNVFRVLARIFGVFTPIDLPEGKKIFRTLAEKALDRNRPALYNQAIMDFGATHCLPKRPLCEICPFQIDCHAFQQQVIEQLPVKSKRLIKKSRYFNFIVLMDDSSILIEKRSKQDIWKGLFEFPMVETEHELIGLDNILDVANKLKMNFSSQIVTHIKTSPIYKQTLTHQNIQAHFAIFKLNEFPFMEFSENLTLIPKEMLKNYPFPKIINDFLNDFALTK